MALSITDVRTTGFKAQSAPRPTHCRPRWARSFWLLPRVFAARLDPQRRPLAVPAPHFGARQCRARCCAA